MGRILQEQSPPTGRWYDRPILVGFLGTVIAAVVPATSAIDGCISKSKELELSERKLTHEVSTDYINSYALKDALMQSLNPDLSQTHRLRALRFLAQVAPDRALKEWAASEYREATAYAEIGRTLEALEHARAPQGIPEAPGRAPEGQTPEQWPRNDVPGASEPEDPQVRLVNEINEDARDPKAALTKIKAEIARLEANPDIPADEKTFKLENLKNRLLSLEKRSDFAHVDASPGPGRQTKG